MNIDMRTFRLIGMALLAIMASVNFTACSNDNEPNTGDDVPVTQKYIEYRSYTYSSDYGDRIESAELSYDEKNRLTSIKEGDNSIYYTIDYSSCTITASSFMVTITEFIHLNSTIKAISQNYHIKNLLMILKRL